MAVSEGESMPGLRDRLTVSVLFGVLLLVSACGSDPDAALYWMARMLEGGMDPMVIFRRSLAMAAEDIGLADPEALKLAVAARDARKVLDAVNQLDERAPEYREVLAELAAVGATWAIEGPDGPEESFTEVRGRIAAGPPG
jgi:hypothetical protein